MNIFSRDTRKIRLNGPLPIDPETGIYSRNFFIARLKEERERSKRTSHRFSLLVVDAELLSMALKGGARRFAHIHETRLIENLFSTSRKIDILGWFDAGKVGILMPYTEESGVLKVKDRISSRIRRNWPSSQRLRLEDFFQGYTFGGGLPNDNGPSVDGNNPTSSGCGHDEKPLYADLLTSTFSSSLKRLAKRTVDILGSLFGIMITSPLLVIIAILIKLTSSGPILFRQVRVGFLGRSFIFLKFRSMAAGADQNLHRRYVKELINARHETINRGTEENPLYKITNDPRVTPLGRILRKSSLDELPQLFNILKGEMSLVGPRPPIPYEVQQYKLWHYGRFFEVKPGLTGLWQVSGRNRTSFEDMVRFDLQYAENWSLWLDIKIILKTLTAVFTTEGAY
jgi:lipopolysaccharide/colanic/teichoic acid biosynthesis glycosyltransferase